MRCRASTTSAAISTNPATCPGWHRLCPRHVRALPVLRAVRHVQHRARPLHGVSDRRKHAPREMRASLTALDLSRVTGVLAPRTCLSFAWESLDNEDEAFDRVAILGYFHGQYYVATYDLLTQSAPICHPVRPRWGLAKHLPTRCLLIPEAPHRNAPRVVVMSGTCRSVSSAASTGRQT